MNVHDSKQLKAVIKELSDFESLQKMHYECIEADAMPSLSALEEIVQLCRALLFPGFFGYDAVNKQNIAYHMGICSEKLYQLLSKQIHSENRDEIALTFIQQLPAIRAMLAEDVIAAYNGDPAAESYAEVIACYPGIRAISSYRIAHALLKLGVPTLPRMITELAHSETGIDIHPGAEIGRSFSIDHGTGVVIGATAILGNNVKLYQGVTLGAKSFPLDEEGNPIKGVPRHPILEDNVIVYSNATILGRVTIGKDSTIGGNIWVTQDVAAGSRLIQAKQGSKSSKEV
jgi:serine O-acetyltransferase